MGEIDVKKNSKIFFFKFQKKFSDSAKKLVNKNAIKHAGGQKWRFLRFSRRFCSKIIWQHWSRPVGLIVFAHVVCPPPLFKSRKTKQQKTMFATGVTMGLAEWIIDYTCLVSSYFYDLYSTIISCLVIIFSVVRETELL